MTPTSRRTGSSLPERAGGKASRRIPTSLLALAVLGLLGCRTITTEEFDALQRLSVAMAEARKDYKLQPGDTVRVVVYRAGQLPPEYQQELVVQPDGKVTLVNVDLAIQAEGRTVPELQQIILELYEPIFSDEGAVSKLDVTVQFLTSQKRAWLPDQIYVVGEVYRPQAIPYRKGLTVLNALAHAGGWRYTANESRVVVLRSDTEGQTVTREVDIEAVVGHEASDLELFPGDVVYMPLSTIARVNLFIEFYIRGLIPINPSTLRYLAAGI